MSFNGSGTFQLNSGGLPYVTGTTISSTTANNLNTDLATGLSTCITKDGQTTVTANLPMSTFKHTNVAAATTRTDYARASQVQDSGLLLIGSVSGTNTIAGSLTPAITAYAAGQFYGFIPANTNTGATTININSVGARNVFWNGAACVGGEIRQNVPCMIYDDGTRVHIVGNGFNAPFLDTHAVVEGSADSTKKVRFEVDGLTTATTRVVTVPDRDLTLGENITLATEQASTSGTSIDFTSIPAGVKRIVIMFNAVSTNGTSNILIQIGPSGGVETTNYVSETTRGAGIASSTAGYIITDSVAAASGMYGSIQLDLQNAASFEWSCFGVMRTSSGNGNNCFSGGKALAAELARLRVTTVAGADTFDNGTINISYER